MSLGVPALEGVLGALPDDRGRREMSPGLAEDPVVEHEAADALTPGGRVGDEVQLPIPAGVRRLRIDSVA